MKNIKCNLNSKQKTMKIIGMAFYAASRFLRSFNYFYFSTKKSIMLKSQTITQSSNTLINKMKFQQFL